MVPTFSSSAQRTFSTTRPLVSISPRFARLSPPVIIIGMHRSGTSLVSGMLSILGAYMDPDWPRNRDGSEVVPPDSQLRRNGYGEAVSFRILNERLLAFAGSDWANPDSFLSQRTRALVAQRCLTAIGTSTYGRLRREYLDRSPVGEPEVWGWKDPRNSLTLPFWLEAFPHARILHIRRDPEAITDSLLRRQEVSVSALADAEPTWSRVAQLAADPVRIARAVARRVSFRAAEPHPPHRLDRNRCRDLTETYVDECTRFRFLSDRYEEVHYEDILRAPRLLAARLADFAGLAGAQHQIARAAAFVNADNAASGSSLSCFCPNDRRKTQ